MDETPWYVEAFRADYPTVYAHRDPQAEAGTIYRPRWIIRGAPVVGGVSARLGKESDLQKLWTVSEQEIGEAFDVAAIVKAAA